MPWGLWPLVLQEACLLSESKTGVKRRSGGAPQSQTHFEHLEPGTPTSRDFTPHVLMGGARKE